MLHAHLPAQRRPNLLPRWPAPGWTDRAAARRSAPQANQPVGGHKHDNQEDHPDQGLKPLGHRADVLRVVVDQDVYEGADPRPLEPEHPPITAIRSTSIVAVRSMVEGEICAFHQTERIPAIAAMSARG